MGLGARGFTVARVVNSFLLSFDNDWPWSRVKRYDYSYPFGLRGLIGCEIGNDSGFGKVDPRSTPVAMHDCIEPAAQCGVLLKGLLLRPI